MRSALAMAFIGTFAMVAGWCGGVEASDFISCANVKDDAERLACYDLLAKESLSQEAREGSANASDEAAERSRIISRCREEMGDYGSAMVKACADQDIEAYQALERYPVELRSFVDRCEREMGRYGWSMVKACADQDIDAERALSDMMAE